MMPLLALSAPVGRSLQDPPLPKKPGLPGVTPAMKAASPSTSNLGFLRSKMTTWFCKDNDANNVACDFYRFSQALKAETDATKRQEMLKARQADYMSMSTEAKKAKTTAAREGWSRMVSLCASKWMPYSRSYSPFILSVRPCHARC